MVQTAEQRERFIDAVLSNHVNRAILDRCSTLAVPDWWLTGGAVFQTVWNVLDGRAPTTGITDYDIFYFDPLDLSYEAEDVVVQRAKTIFGDLDSPIEIRNEARVHLWYEQHFGIPATPFTSTRDAIDHFVSTTCCYALKRDAGGGVEVYAPHGYGDLFDQHVRPNPVFSARSVYDAKTTRWQEEWPSIVVDPWPDSTRSRAQ